jgi:ankyrin repeat protein
MTPLQVMIASNGKKNKSNTPSTPSVPQGSASHKLDFPIQSKCIDYFIDNGANVNAQDFYGLTALHYASIKDNFDGAGHLIRITNNKIDIKVSE